ncbi:MAG: hypothetical protein ACK5CE_22865 [Actinomycetes bacterium]
MLPTLNPHHPNPVACLITIQRGAVVPFMYCTFTVALYNVEIVDAVGSTDV